MLHSVLSHGGTVAALGLVALITFWDVMDWPGLCLMVAAAGLGLGVMLLLQIRSQKATGR